VTKSRGGKVHDIRPKGHHTKGNKHKNREPFVMTDEIVARCARRIEGALKRRKGILVHSSEKGVRRELVGMIRAERGEFGWHYEEKAHVVDKALELLRQKNNVRWDDSDLDVKLILREYDRSEPTPWTTPIQPQPPRPLKQRRPRYGMV
jgi:hypothetical protein